MTNKTDLKKGKARLKKITEDSASFRGLMRLSSILLEIIHTNNGDEGKKVMEGGELSSSIKKG